MTEELPKVYPSDDMIKRFNEAIDAVIECFNALWELLQEIIPPMLEAISGAFSGKLPKLHRKKRINKKWLKRWDLWE